MAYSDYGAFVWLNGKRREDKEDVAVFASDNVDWINRIHHGILGDGNIRVMCHKQGLPSIYEATEDAIKNIKYCDDNTDYFKYEPISFEYKGYKFYFKSGKPYYAKMITPDGDIWECQYDYMYGMKDGEKNETNRCQ